MKIIAPKVNIRRQALQRFRDAIPHTSPCTGETYAVIAAQFDAAVCGSDQIWRPSQAGDLVPAFWLCGIPDYVRKVAYAASLGVCSYGPELALQASKRLESFHRIGVREDPARNYLLKLNPNVPIHVVPDPVFLLERECWQNIVDDEKSSAIADYVFVYMIHGTKFLLDSITEFAKAQRLDVVSFPFMNYKFNADIARFGSYRNFDATPEQWLGLLNNAKYVFTDSFHACAFSIILNKDFYVSSANERSISRISHLLATFGLQDRLIPGKGLEPNAYFVDPMHAWNDVNRILDSVREVGEAFLKEALADG